MLVDNKILEVRFASEYMLSNLTFSSSSEKCETSEASASPYIWCKILDCIRNFITQHDYKSCRDILRMLLELVKKIPHDESSVPPQLESEAWFSKSARKNKLVADQNVLIDDRPVIYHQAYHSSATNDIKLEYLFEVIIKTKKTKIIFYFS